LWNKIKKRAVLKNFGDLFFRRLGGGGEMKLGP